MVGFRSTTAAAAASAPLHMAKQMVGFRSTTAATVASAPLHMAKQMKDFRSTSALLARWCKCCTRCVAPSWSPRVAGFRSTTAAAAASAPLHRWLASALLQMLPMCYFDGINVSASLAGWCEWYQLHSMRCKMSTSTKPALSV